MKPYQLAASALGALMLLSPQVYAEMDLGSLELFSKDNPNSPVPKGLVIGGAAIGGNARYKEQKDEALVVPGAFYFGDHLMYLGDRARYYFHVDENIAAYGFGRVRFGNLDPDDSAAFKGMNERKWEFEAGAGATLITRYALLSARLSSDVTGRSNGQELLLWADFPIIMDKLLIMPGFGMMIRSDKLANYYFGGVSAQEATAERPEWDTGTTFSPMAAVVTSYRFNEKWVGLFAANYERYDKDIANSPIVQHDGELYAIIALGYSW